MLEGIFLYEIWSCLGAPHGEKCRECWVWTVVVKPDGGISVDFEIGDHSKGTFFLLYERLPEMERYRTDAYPVYG